MDKNSQTVNEYTGNNVFRDIFKAIHEGKWLSIEYRNKEGQITKYWIGIKDLNPFKRTLKVDGLHLGHYGLAGFDCIYIDSIISSNIIEGSYCEVNHKLVEDISLNPGKYGALFNNVANLKILNYLEDCNRMNTTPYKTDFELIRYLDRESFPDDIYYLTEEQFKEIVKYFQLKTSNQREPRGRLQLQQLCMNVLSIHTLKGLYVLAYRKLELDVKNRVLKPDEDITICTEFTMNGERESIRKFLDAEDFELLKDFEKNQEQIKNLIQMSNNRSVDDMPYFIGIGMDVILDLHSEYKAIVDMYNRGAANIPIKAFFGELTKKPVRRKEYPIALISRKVNLDQLLAINNVMKYPLVYIQGPPGTGKTKTIINTICTAFFNNQTVLFSAYNNHPLDAVFDELISIKYKDKVIPFPVIRIGNDTKVREACVYMKELYLRTSKITVFEKTLDKNKDDRIRRAKLLSELLHRHETVLDLKERDETLKHLITYYEKSGSLTMLPFQTSLVNQSRSVEEKINSLGEVQEQDALKLLLDDEEDFRKYLYYTSAKYIKKIDEPKNEDLKNIIFMEDADKQAEKFNKYLSEEENVRKFLKVFPVVITTCMSAYKIGKPQSYFDTVIIDEASQCNTAAALVPILRGDSLMLVGDPQQLNPVILLDDVINEKLKAKYFVSQEYDFCKNSIYKTYLACDSVSDETLLRYHYRCHTKIIDFNNRKYYNGKLNIKSSSKETEPLVYIDMKGSTTDYKNTSPDEVEEIIRYAVENKNKTIGVITPFVNQKKLIEKALEDRNITNVTCGTVHAFQGDEKDQVIFSTAISDRTSMGTYEWLKNNKELINVATSRARDRLILLASNQDVERLHNRGDDDDIYELVQYVKNNGKATVTQKTAFSRALGVKPFSSATEEAFLENLNHAMGNIFLSENKFIVKEKVQISQIFEDNRAYKDLFYTGHFDFVVYEKNVKSEMPVLAIELDGKEHFTKEAVKLRDRQKNEICARHNLHLIRVDNTYARRYNYIKGILVSFFQKNK